jgi:hypothetical protein
MQRKPTKNTRGPNAAEKRHIGWLKDRMICAACKQYGPVIAHHAEGATFRHNKVLIGHLFVLGLCQSCDNIVTRESRKAFRDSFGSQSQLWAEQFEDCPMKHDFPQEEIKAIISYGR